MVTMERPPRIVKPTLGIIEKNLTALDMAFICLHDLQCYLDGMGASHELANDYYETLSMARENVERLLRLATTRR